MEKKIVRRETVSRAVELGDMPELLQRIFKLRDVTTTDEVSKSLKHLYPFMSLSNIEQATSRLHKAISCDEKIVIIGDFDADGATSTTVAVQALRAFGAKHVDYLIPNRFDYGYGLTPEIVEVAKERKSPDLIITVDNGISSVAGVKRARELEIDVLVTDHHLVGDALPEDCIIVNPNLPGDQFPSKCIAGVGVIFYVMIALRAYLSDQGWFEQSQIASPNMAQYLDLVALGTVADVVPLDRNNRIMVFNGLQRIRKGVARPGIAALIEISGRNIARVRATDLGYAIGPRLNAAGRLDDMSRGVECMLSDDYQCALGIAKELDQLNVERRALESQMQEQAFSAVDRLNLQEKKLFGVCVYQPDWHQGIIGLVAARVKEKLHRPVVAFAKESETTIKGSARSVSGLHIRDALDALAKRYPHLMNKFGGHAMAAGLSIKTADFEEFSIAFNEIITERVTEERLQATVYTDGELTSDHFNLKTAEMLRQAGPWGQGFPEPLFDGSFAVIEQRIVGSHHLKLLLMAPDSDYCIDAIAFNVDVNKWPNNRCGKIKAAYRLDINEYRGREKLQLLVEELVAE